MNRTLRRLLVVAAAFYFAPVSALPAHGGEIRYSWSGLILPGGAEDPWQVGPGGQPFELSFAVSPSAADLHELNVEAAAFETTDMQLVVAGEVVPFLGGGSIDLTDDWSGIYDLFTAHGRFERLGAIEEIGSLVALPLTTFAFSEEIEPPPYFSSTANVDRAVCCGGTYALVVSAGTRISVVPEPGLVVLLVASGVVCGGVARDCALSRRGIVRL